MSSESAERWVVISALIVAGVYAYRRLTEATAKPPIKLANLTGAGPPPPLGTFATAWGVTFLGVSVLASASPQLGGAFAILIASGDLLANGQAIIHDLAQPHTSPDAPGTAAGTGKAITSLGDVVGNAISNVGAKVGAAAPSGGGGGGGSGSVGSAISSGASGVAAWDSWYNAEFNAGYTAASRSPHPGSLPSPNSAFTAGVISFLSGHPRG